MHKRRRFRSPTRRRYLCVTCSSILIRATWLCASRSEITHAKIKREQDESQLLSLMHASFDKVRHTHQKLPTRRLCVSREKLHFITFQASPLPRNFIIIKRALALAHMPMRRWWLFRFPLRFLGLMKSHARARFQQNNGRKQKLPPDAATKGEQVAQRGWINLNKVRRFIRAAHAHFTF